MNLSSSGQMAILDRLRSAKKIVFFTGAGVSAESGIPTFRDASNSLWANVDPMAVASIAGCCWCSIFVRIWRFWSELGFSD